MAENVLPLEDFLPYRLNRLADAVSRDFSRIYRERFGLTRPEWRLLATLGQFGTMTATAVGQHSSMHKTKVSRAVAELEKRRWLTRAPDGSDRRIEHLTLTRPGRSAYLEMVPLARNFERQLLAAFSERDRTNVADAMRLLESAAQVRSRRPAAELLSSGE